VPAASHVFERVINGNRELLCCTSVSKQFFYGNREPKKNEFFALFVSFVPAPALGTLGASSPLAVVKSARFDQEWSTERAASETPRSLGPPGQIGTI